MREILGLVVAAGLSLCCARWTPALAARLLRPFSRLGRRRGLAVAGVGLAAGLMSMGISLVRMPAPHIHDEFSYLLAADTFAHGRITNATHPMWQHFESFHILQQPTYTSKYPPGQGMILALGQALTGYPAAGLWIGTALAAAAVCWMLQGYAPGRWALLGGALMALSPSIQLVWGQAYWGGDVALIGGALVYGGVPRLVARPRVGAALITGLGLAVLANSRPFEGLCASAPAAIALLVWLLGRRRPTLAVAAAKVVLPIVGVLAVAAAGMAYHNLRTTGDPLTMPYIVYERTYGMGPVFLWDPPRPQPRYRHPIMEKYYAGWAMGTYRMQLGPWNLLKVKGSQILGLWRFFLGPTLTVPLLALPWVLKKRRNLLAAACVATTLAGLLGACWIHPHYFAPAVPALFLLVVQGMRYVAQWRWRGRPVGRPLVFGLVVVYAVVFIAAAGHHFKNAELTGERMARTLESIGRQPGKHLVVVRYGPDHNLHDEWVYNAADIDAAKVVLARDMSPQENDELLRYFADRRVWLLQADAYRVQAYRR